MVAYSTSATGQGSSVRPSCPADGPQIATLLAEAGLQSNVRREDLYWKYWQPRSDWTGPRSFVVVRGDEILAHAAIVPGICVWKGARLVTLHLIDWAARPNAMGSGVVLMKQIGRMADVLLSIGGSEPTLQIVPHLGFRPLGTATGYVRPLHSLQILKSADGPGWKRPLRVVRSMLWVAMAPSGDPNDSQTHRVRRDQLHALAAALPIAGRDSPVLSRSASLFEYFLACPIASMELYSWKRGIRARGYFLLAFTPAQVRLVDCSVDSEDPDDWRAMVQCAVQQAHDHGNTAELVTCSSDNLLSVALTACGFHARGSQPIQVLQRKGLSIDLAGLRVHMLDDDAGYRHRGQTELWA